MFIGMLMNLFIIYMYVNVIVIIHYYQYKGC